MASTRRIAAALVAGVTALGVVACGSDNGGGGGGGSSSGAPKSLRAGALFLDAQGFYGGVRYGFEQRAKAKNVNLKLTQTNAAGDPSAESSFLSTLVSSRVDAIIVSATSATASVPAIRQASQAGIPVICYNTCINNADMQKYVYAYAVGDPVQFGRDTGKAAAAYFKRQGITSPKIGVVNCEFVEVCKQRRQGFEESLKAELPGYKIVANQAGTTDDKAISVATNIISANPKLDAFYGESGGATIGAVKAVQASGKTGKVAVFGSDMTTDIANALKDGTILKSSTDVSGRIIGGKALDLVLDAVQDKKQPSKIVPVPIVTFTAENKRQVTTWLDTHKNGLP